MDAKTGIAQGRCTSKIQDGRHLDLRYTLLRINKGLWPRDISLCVILLAILLLMMLFFLNNSISSQLLNKEDSFAKTCLKLIWFHTRPDVAGGKVSPGRGI